MVKHHASLLLDIHQTLCGNAALSRDGDPATGTHTSKLQNHRTTHD